MADVAVLWEHRFGQFFGIVSEIRSRENKKPQETIINVTNIKYFILCDVVPLQVPVFTLLFFSKYVVGKVQQRGHNYEMTIVIDAAIFL